VTLRDLTRIHSDEQGVLRVETPAGTALTATLLGFDVAQVQSFFAQVRDTTARAKEQPVSPLPTPGGLKTFGTAPETPATAPSTGAPGAVAPAESAPPPRPPARAVPEGMTSSPARVQAPAPPPTAGVSGPRDTSDPGGAAVPAVPRPGTARPAAEAPAPRPVVISSSAFTPSTARTPLPVTEPFRPPEPTVLEPAAPAPAAAPVVEAPVPARAAAPQPDALARQAAAVEGLTGRLRFLGGVLFVAALALAAVQFTSGARLDGLWTLLSGGVGTIALLALADMARLLALSARAGRPADTADDR
jgi:hypothetical protein